jgi:group I intron endonuclease
MLIDVYCHTSPSGKRYVGYSARGMAARWRRHVEFARAGSNYLLHRAIRKHGAESFRHELLAQCDTVAGAKITECVWIAARGTLASAGYNATAGGEGVVACPEVRRKLSAAWTPERRARNAEITAQRNQGNTYGEANRGKKRTPEARAVMADKARGHTRHTTPHSVETRAKMSASQKRRHERKSVPL